MSRHRQYHPSATHTERQLAARAAFELLCGKREYGEMGERFPPTSCTNSTRGGEQLEWSTLGLVAAVDAGLDRR
jgi:hypothetical protein